MDFCEILASITQNLFATGLFSALSILATSQYLSNLVHQSKTSAWLKIAFRIHQAPPWQFLAQPPELNTNLSTNLIFYE
jgi:hypothetical protein